MRCFASGAQLLERFKTGAGRWLAHHQPALLPAHRALLQTRLTSRKRWLGSWIRRSKACKPARSSRMVAGTSAAATALRRSSWRSTTLSPLVGFDYHHGAVESLCPRGCRRMPVVVAADEVSRPPLVRRNFPARLLHWCVLFDCLHDIGDPIGAATHVRRVDEPDEADDRRARSRTTRSNPTERRSGGSSTRFDLLCTPASRSRFRPSCGLGARSRRTTPRQRRTQRRLHRLRRATETPFTW